MSATARATITASEPSAPPEGTLGAMTSPAHAEGPEAEPATVHHLRHPLDPTPEQTAARIARRRLGRVVYTATRAGAHRARYLSHAGIDAYGHDEDGTYHAQEDIMHSPSPFTAPPTQETTMDPNRTATVYSKPSCVQCNSTYRALTKKGIDYVVVDVTEDEAALAHILQLGYQQVPVVELPPELAALDVTPAHWSGYRPDLITPLAAAALAEVSA